MQVVTTGMHFARMKAYERKPGLLFDRQRVHVGANNQSRSRTTTLNQTHNAGLTNTCLMLDAQTFKLSRNDACSPFNIKSGFRMSVNIPTHFNQMRFNVVSKLLYER
ncbi:hypothetical protein D3C80_1172600 [compost metagenome]